VSSDVRGDLAALAVFSDLSPGQIDWLADHGEVMELAAGDWLFKEGDPATDLFVVLDGTLELIVGIGGQQVPSFTQHRGDVTGLLPYSRMRIYGGGGRAGDRLRVLRVPASAFPAMLQAIPELGQRLVSVMADRVREFTRQQQQREKMMALGKLSAGLAHELNNPAAAVRRSAEGLRAQVDLIPRLLATLAEHRTPPAAFESLAACVRDLGSRPAPLLEPLARSRNEEAVGQWLDEHGVEESWVLAETLVAAGVTTADLDELANSVPEGAAGAAARWLEAMVGVGRLADEIAAASARISELVGSIKVYSHMDRGGDRQETDVRHGLDSTLVMMGHRLKQKQVTLDRHYADPLPLIQAYPGELNQVWTNLIDNAIDAVEEGGRVGLDVGPDGSTLAVRITDNGHGVPAALRERIFEPFFTTKQVGSGTGLGLDLVQQIVVSRHGGSVELESEPGRTVFTVRLPIVGA
jgi:signal transduction histidine kinase